MYQKTTLPNGLRLVTATMPHARSVSINFFVATGSRYEDDALAGISHFIEHLCFRGTPKRPTSREISEAIESTGGALNAATDKELTVYWCKVIRAHFKLALEVMTDMLLHSRFAKEDIEKERQVIIEEINMCYDSPAQLVDLLIDESLWPRQPMGRDIAGSKDSVSALTRQNMLDYMEQQYQPKNIVVSIAGDIEHGEALAAVDEALGSWVPDHPVIKYAPSKMNKTGRVVIQKKDTEQTHLCLALPGIPALHPRRFALSLLNVILGEGMSSRLFTEVRDKLGLAYSVQSFVDYFRDTGSMIISAGVDNDKLEVAIAAILKELSKLKDNVPASDLAKAKELSKGRLQLRMEDSRNMAGWGGGEEIMTGRVMSVDEVITIIDAITVDDLEFIARELLVGEKLRLAAVGPIKGKKKLEELLKL